MEEKLFDLLGLGVPFYLGAATYAVFAWLDSNASGEETKLISPWLHGRPQHKPDLGNLIISAFDRIYTSPLLSFRAFRRSAVISSVIWFLLFFVPWLFNYWGSGYTSIPELRSSRTFGALNFVGDLTMILLTDYGSLLLVRQFLRLAQRRPISVSILSAIVGLSVAMISFTIIIALSVIVIYLLDPALFTHTVRFEDMLDLLLLVLPVFFVVMRPAFIIHLWLPLFALSSLAAKLIFWIFSAVEWAQWFLKQGDAHPFKAIGVVATIIVFGSAMLVKEGWALLSVLERS